jgi:hypothetical protein
LMQSSGARPLRLAPGFEQGQGKRQFAAAFPSKVDEVPGLIPCRKGNTRAN